MQKGTFRKTVLSIAIGGVFVSSSNSIYARLVDERVLSESKEEKTLFQTQKKLKPGFQYLYKLRGGEPSTLSINGINLIHENGYTAATGAVIVYDEDGTDFAIKHEGKVFGITSPVIQATGDHHGIWVNADNVNIGNTIIRGNIFVEDGDAYRIDGSIIGGSLYIGSKAELRGARAIYAGAGGSIAEDQQIIVKGTLRGTGGNAIDFSASPEKLTMTIDGGSIFGKILGSTTSTDDQIGIKGDAHLYGTIEDVDKVFFLESTDYANVHEDITMSSGSADVTVQSGGKVSFKKEGTHNINGNLTFDEGANAKFKVTGSSPVMSVTGNLRKEENVTFLLRRGSYSPGRLDDDFVLIQAANVSFVGLTAESFIGNPLVNVSDIKVTSTEVTLDFEDRTVPEVIDSLSEAGDSARDGMEVMLENLADGDGPGALVVVSEVESVEELAELSSELRVNNAGATQAINNSLAGLAKEVVVHRMARMREDRLRGIGTGDALEQDGFWMQALDPDISQDNRTNDTGGKIFGYDADVNGVSIGYETERNNWMIGGAFTLANTSIDKLDSVDHSTVKNHQFTLYGSWDNDLWFVDGLINMGLSNHDRNRYLDGFSDDAIMADFHSKHYGVQVLAGLDHSINSLEIQPLLGFNYGLIQTDSYKEKAYGEASDFAMSVDKQTHQRVEFGAGIALSETFKVAKGELESALRLMAWYDVKGDQVETTARYLIGGQDYDVKGADPVKESYQGTASVTYRRNDNFSFVFGYSRNQKPGYHSDSYFGRIQYDF
ncbi:autotransporter outer membrane beta-barrel domain-containing protein [Candidatus Sororendozoicomonas aggregata]|uniref:autotransporter family protein n=1 Tax=Candidatus Sororendozoicomonas aggregata TaxID=3073239 RepID=UPI002ED3DA97